MSERRRTPTRPYARKRNTPPSVTTILNVISKDGMVWGATKELSLHVAHNIDDVCQGIKHNLDAEVDRLRRHHDVLWAGRAAMGTLVHAVNEAWSWDEDVDLAAVYDDIMGKPRAPRIWRDRCEEVLAEAGPYIDGLERFWNECNPRTVQTEEVVRDPAKPNDYIGQRDWVCTIDGTRWLLDLKSTAEKDYEKGFYADSFRLQLAAYRLAPEIVTYDDEGTETGTLPNEPVDRCGIVHMRGDGGYQLIEVQAGEQEHARFLAARQLHEWVNKEANKPAPVIVRPELVAMEGAA